MTRTLSVLSLVSILAIPAMVEAQPSDEDREAAREAFQAGERAFAENDNEVALGHFQRAFELAPHDAVRFNIAVCLERLGRHREAALEYDAAVVSTQIEEEARERARRDGDRARARLGTLAVEGEPGGARVVIDGEELCTLPCEIPVDPGDHRIVVRSADGEVTREASVGRGGRSTVRVEAPEVDEEQEQEASVTPDVPVEESQGPGFLLWTGVGLAVIGGAGIVLFGLQASSLHDDYLAMPTTETRDDGACSCEPSPTSPSVSPPWEGVLALVDLIFLAPQSVERDSTVGLGFDGVRLRF